MGPMAEKALNDSVLGDAFLEFNKLGDALGDIGQSNADDPDAPEADDIHGTPEPPKTTVTPDPPVAPE